MASNYINSKIPDTFCVKEVNKITFKLRIMVLFSFSTESQVAKARSFRSKSPIDQCIRGENTEAETSGANVHYVDEDENNYNYVVIDKVFKVDERSPKAMENMSRHIDDFVFGYCIREDAEKVIPVLFVPTLGEISSVVPLFFNSFPIKCFSKDSNLHYKIDIHQRLILQCRPTEIKSHNKKKELSRINFENSKPSNLTYKIFVLAAYYTYFYVDYEEQTKSSIFKKDLSDPKRIQRFLEKKEGKPKSGWWNVICTALVNALLLPKSVMCGIVDFLFNYDGHLKNRIYSRICDVLDVTCCSNKVKAIYSILSNCKEKPISMHEFFDHCNYWQYIEKYIPGLEEECKKWEVVCCDRVQLTGFAAIMLKNGDDNIYSFKGTDFDSYGKDWICTNLLQGLTGYSMQHHNAIANAQKYDQEIGSKGNLWFVGHSLGGGLASAAAISTIGRSGYTFNAAGLNVIGVKFNQLMHNPSNIIRPSKSWNRVFPYRIKGEVLDTLQKTVLRLISVFTLERGYGMNSVDLEIKDDMSCLKRHGINNFLYAGALRELKEFREFEGDSRSTDHNKIKKIFLSASAHDLNFILC